MPLLKKILKWVGIVIALAFVALILGRAFYLRLAANTQLVVEQIHATKLTLDDVMGAHLPPVPANPDATVQGVDANKNGIRDDVELAIFKAYPSSAKTRAVLLQYALVLQMQMTLPIVNKETVTATVEDGESRADICFWSLSSRSDMTKFLSDMDKYHNFVKKLQINTDQRSKYLKDLLQKNLGSYSSSNGGCDLNLSTLPN